MKHTEAQGRAIRLSSGDEHGEDEQHMDKEGKVHQCPHCGSVVECKDEYQEGLEKESKEIE